MNSGRNKFNKNRENCGPKRCKIEHDLPIVQYISPPVEVVVDEKLEEEEMLMREGVEEVQRILGYSFNDPLLLEEALTHPSYPNKPSYQRLECVGDAVIGLIFANFFYLAKPKLDAGPMSILRAANISTEKLARVAVRHGLYRFLRHSSPNLNNQVRDFVDAIMQQPEEKAAEVVSYGGCVVKAPKVLADIVESVVAAVYVDCNFDLIKLWTVIRGFLEPIITVENHDQQPVTTLYEICQSQGKAVEFVFWKNENNQNIANVFVDGEHIGIGVNENKEIAKLNAARNALQKLQTEELAGENGILDRIKTNKRGRGEEIEAKKQLNELCMKKRWPKPLYRVLSEDGPSHNRKFICSVEVKISDQNIMTLSDRKSRVRDAENAAAYVMLSEIEKYDY